MMKIRNIIIAVCLFGLAVPVIRAASPNLPQGVVEIDTSPGAKSRKADSGYPTIAGDVAGDSLWLGREGGLRRYDRVSGKWEFLGYPGKHCPGRGTISVISNPPFIWTRMTSTGALCRFNTIDKTWSSLTHWTVLAHTGPGFAFLPGSEILYVASAGSPDWEGVSLIDRKSGEWIKLLKTKPVSAIYVEKDILWLGVPEGILKINRITEDYTYIQPFEHGGGSMVKDIMPVPGGLAFATVGTKTAVLGDTVKVTKDYVQVYMKKSNSWHKYKKSDRDKLIADIQSGKIIVSNIATKPGLLLYRKNKWTLMNSKNGLASDEVLDIEKDERFLYLSGIRGITVLDMKSYKPVVLNRAIFGVMRQVRRTIVDDKYLWVFSNKGLFRVEKRLLFSSSR